MSFENVSKFESIIASFYNAPYAIATDSCTHAIELVLRYQKPKNKIFLPSQTYISVPFLAIKLGLDWDWKDEKWENYYNIDGTNIIDAAVYWRKSGYIKDSFMCLSFQYQKHLNIGRGGMILTDNFSAYKELVKMSYDGRSRNSPWREQNISTIGFHYYMTPESAEIGIKKFENIHLKELRLWSYKDYPLLNEMQVFNS